MGARTDAAEWIRGKADGLISTHLGHADRRRRFSKAAARQLGGNSGSGWFLLVCFRTTAAFDMT